MIHITYYRKFLLVVLTASTITIGCYSAQSNSMQLFSKGNSYYQNGDYDKAYDAYMSINSKTAHVNYNLGNCAYKLKRYGYALLFWRRAEMAWGLTGREELVKNINLVKSNKHIEPLPALREGAFTQQFTLFSSVTSFVFSIIRSTHLLHLQVIVLLIWILLFASLGYLIRKKHHILAVLLFGILLNAAWMLSIKYSYLAKKHLVVVAPSTQLTAGPGTSFALLDHLHEAQEAVILKTSGDYYKIRTNNTIGWVNKNNVELL